MDISLTSKEAEILLTALRSITTNDLEDSLDESVTVAEVSTIVDKLNKE